MAPLFMGARSRIGVETVRTWAQSLPPGAVVLDLGCGSGVPISEALMADGCVVYGVDASPTLVAAFRRRFPDAPVACEPAEGSAFFATLLTGRPSISLGVEAYRQALDAAGFDLVDTRVDEGENHYFAAVRR